MAALDDLIAFGGLPRERVEVTVPEYGNMAAASLPVACALAEEQGRLQPGDRVMWLGLAAGISLGVVLMRY